MPDVVVMARVKAKPGKENDLSAAWQKAAVESRKEAGCAGYRLFQCASDPTLFVSVETWKSQAAADHHMATPHVQALLKVVPDYVAQPPEILPFNEVGG